MRNRNKAQVEKEFEQWAKFTFFDKQVPNPTHIFEDTNLQISCGVENKE
jgi:hypothetical protein